MSGAGGVLAVMDGLRDLARHRLTMKRRDHDKQVAAGKEPNWQSAVKAERAEYLMQQGDEARAAVAELIEQQKRDAQLVAVLLSYLNDNLTEREKGRLGAELMARDLSYHDQRRRAALARVGGEA
jgi:hypothetical protein